MSQGAWTTQKLRSRKIAWKLGLVREKDEDEKDKVNSLLNVENTQSTILSFPLFRCRLLPDASAKGTKERFQE